METSLGDVGLLKLMVITDGKSVDPAEIVALARKSVSGGATCVQLRLKNANPRTQLEVARALVAAIPVPVIVNDRADVALAAGAAGVHLGADDVPVRAIRAIVPRGFIIGASVGSDAEVENSRLADYVGIGPAFSTGTKDDAGQAIAPLGVKRLAQLCRQPAIAIGGITAANVRFLDGAGVVGVAVVSAVFGAPDPEAAALELRTAVDSWRSARSGK
jgi:thiamine-phosphate pyrophosphorylase